MEIAIRITISLGDAREGIDRILDNPYFEEMFSVPYFSLIIHTSTRLHREFFYAIRQ